MKDKNWYPGHMAKGMRLTINKIQRCNCVIEVHDARIPFSGRNPKFKLLIEHKPKLLVLNKSDLCDPQRLKESVNRLITEGEHVVLTNCKTQFHSSIKQVMKNITDIVKHHQEMIIKVLIIGMPNVGKSSLINALRRHFIGKGKGTLVGSVPGITRNVTSYIKVSSSPAVYVVDTPGIMIPSIKNSEVLLKLAAVGTLKDHLVGETIIADYILFCLNQQHNYKYTDVYGFKQPSDDIDEVIESVAKRINAYHKGGELDILRATNHFLKQFREGKLGYITLL